MDDAVHENCGVAAIYLFDELGFHPLGGASFYLSKMLLQLQHRGQLSAGMTTYYTDRLELLDTHREVGLVSEVFRMNHQGKFANLLNRYRGVAGVGHVRYATSGMHADLSRQPIETHGMRKWDWFSFGFNGNIANFRDLRAGLERQGHIDIFSDVELIRHMLRLVCERGVKPDLIHVFSDLGAKLDGAYNIVFINALGEMVVLRDPNGFRPLCFGSTPEMFAAASESVALEHMGIGNIQSVNPGEMIVVSGNQVQRIQYADNPGRSHCMFEWVYFSDVSSIIDGTSVYEVRYRLGESLAEIEPLRESVGDDLIIVPVPDTAKAAADGMGYTLGVRVMEGLKQNRYLGRTFIEDTGRRERVEAKYSLIHSALRGKRVILVDDSVVRGATLKGLARRIKVEGGAREVHLRISCPPIAFPCFYGIDMSTLGELLVRSCGVDLDDAAAVNREVTACMEVDSVAYQTVEGLVKAIGLPRDELCLACLNGKYPTASGRQLVDEAKSNFAENREGRTYELTRGCG